MHQLDATFSALADPTRRAIIAQLAEGSATVNELAEPFDISLPAISRHLKVLEGAGLISREVEAQKRRCRLRPDALKPAEDWIEKTRTFWNEHFVALEIYLDETSQK
jgi:DNA-binding transcriptional ArsR family regulator